MKVNSNTIHLSEETQEYKDLEAIIKKVASDNGVEDVFSISIALSPEKGLINFKTAQEAPPMSQDSLDEISFYELEADKAQESQKKQAPAVGQTQAPAKAPTS